MNQRLCCGLVCQSSGGSNEPSLDNPLADSKEPSTTMDSLPLEVLAIICSFLPRPQPFFQTCSLVNKVAGDASALCRWLVTQNGADGALARLANCKWIQAWRENQVMAAVRLLADSGCSLSGPSACSFLDWAAIKGHAEVASYLLHHGATFQCNAKQLVIQVARGGHCQVLQLLTTVLDDFELRKGDALAHASSSGHVMAVRMLLDMNADPYFQRGAPMMLAAWNGHGRVIEMLVAVGGQGLVHIREGWPICAAAGRGHAEVVKQLLALGADVHACEDASLTQAAQNGHLEVIKLLLDRGADIHARGDHPLQSACCGGQLEAARLLLSRGASARACQDEALPEAVDRGYVDIVQLLLEGGADVRGHTGAHALCRAAVRGRVDVAQLLLQHGARPNGSHGDPLVEACRHGQVQVVGLLLRYGANVNSHGAYALAVSCECKDKVAGTAVVKALLEHGVDVKNNGGEALMAAIRNQNGSLVKLLLDAGADPTSHRHGPTRSAAVCNELDILQAVMEKGGDLGVAMETAAQQGKSSAVSWLLAQSNAELSQQAAGHLGQVALVAATAAGHLEVVQMLLARGAGHYASSVLKDAKQMLLNSLNSQRIKKVLSLLYSVHQQQVQPRPQQPDAQPQADPSLPTPNSQPSTSSVPNRRPILPSLLHLPDRISLLRDYRLASLARKMRHHLLWEEAPAIAQEDLDIDNMLRELGVEQPPALPAVPPAAGVLPLFLPWMTPGPAPLIPPPLPMPALAPLGPVPPGTTAPAHPGSVHQVSMPGPAAAAPRPAPAPRWTRWLPDAMMPRGSRNAAAGAADQPSTSYSLDDDDIFEPSSYRSLRLSMLEHEQEASMALASPLVHPALSEGGPSTSGFMARTARLTQARQRLANIGSKRVYQDGQTQGQSAGQQSSSSKAPDATSEPEQLASPDGAGPSNASVPAVLPTPQPSAAPSTSTAAAASAEAPSGAAGCNTTSFLNNYLADCDDFEVDEMLLEYVHYLDAQDAAWAHFAD